MRGECVICGYDIEGHGHNARPLADGRCCDGCNTFVIIKRLQAIEAMRE